MKKIDLQNKLTEILDYIVKYTIDNGFSPTVRDICADCNIKSTATAYSYLEKLRKKGLLNKTDNKKRAISIDGLSVKNIPLVGTVTAGQPIFAIENIDGYFPLPSEISSNSEQFALKVSGDSMINVGIFNNDVIIVDKQSSAENGEIVVALIDDCATVKRFFKRNGKIVLHPENDQMSDMIYDDVIILGKVKGLYRKL